ncbi:DUF4136 domain-containing protein [bacterium SCSIO 12696]|nr:DUF4136 domain-containing protein [bacterium SCSIO 12696]
MTVFSRLFCALTLLLLTACGQTPVNQVQGSLERLSGFDSYRWGWPPLASTGRHDADLLLQDRILREAVAWQMSSLNIQRQPYDQSAQLTLDYKILFSPEQYADLVQPEGGWVWKRDSEGKLQRNRVDPDAKVTLDRATLQLSVYNSDKSQVLWEAETSELVGHDHPPQEMVKAIEKMVARLFKQR